MLHYYYLLGTCWFTAFVSSKILDTPSGRLQGWTGLSRNNRQYSAFTKIPYARPPVGDLRFKNPVEYGKWLGVYDATDDSPRCLQRNETSDIPMDVIGSEDCLYLNIYAPNTTGKSLPVLIYIHGGSFEDGYPGRRTIARYLMDEDIIFVTLTYRLGPLGFMSLEDDALPGNYGCKDMAMAVKWVYNNIASFGGNPERITISGISAGSAAAHLLVLSPLSREMIQGAIMISGTVVDHMWTIIEPGSTRKATQSFAKFIGCNTTTPRDLVECLQKADPKSLQNAVELFENNPFLPVVEPRGKGAFMPENPFEIVSTKPVITSFASGESIAERIEFYDSPDLVAYYMENLNDYVDSKLRLFGLNPNKCRDRLKARYYEGVKTFDDNVTQLAILDEDARYTYGALDTIQRHKGPKWLYHMEYVGEIASNLSKVLKLAAHASESSYLFDEVSLNEADTLQSINMIKLFVNFVTHRTPNPAGSDLVWNQWTSNEMLRLTNEGNIMANSTYYRHYEDIYDFWKSMYSQNKDR